MGLQAEITLSFPEELVFEEANIEIEIDYSDAWDTFEKVFQSQARSMCPVRTGYLRSTIGGEQNDNTSYTCWAEAEYAQYVEYGTYKMAAQPYFEPAIRAALGEATMVAQEIFEEAEDEFNDEVEQWEEEQRELAEEEADSSTSQADSLSIGSILTSVLIILAQAMVKALINEIFSLLDDNAKSMKNKNGGRLAGGLSCSVEIT